MCMVPKTAARVAQEHVISYLPGRGHRGLACWVAMPRRIVPSATPLVAVHGIRRGAFLQASLFARRAAASGRPVIAPVFDRDTWPGYQQAVLRGRADLALLELVEDLRSRDIIGPGPLDLFGFSGGAQFVHRFAMLHPEHTARLSVASPGWYTFPDQALYPYGLSPRVDHVDSWAPDLIANLGRFLAIPMSVSVGAQDCKPDKNTRSGDAINAQQGVHRLARARRWTTSIKAAGAAMGIKISVQLHVLDGCGHDFETCVRTGHLDRIVLPEPSEVTTACSGLCSAQQRKACAASAPFMLNEVTG